MSGILITAILARSMSWAMESGRQQARELQQLEKLSRALLESTPERSQLTENLSKYIPMMFPSGKILIWLNPDLILLKEPEDWDIPTESIYPWLSQQDEIVTFKMNEHLPWEEIQRKHNPMLLSPIKDIESDETVGGILLDLHTLVHPWDQRALDNLKPGMQALAAAIASALRQEQLYTNTIELQRVSQELKTAGSIQFSLLPYSFPNIPGWQMAVTYNPVGETSGDFYDIINLPDGKVGLVIADVLDKGVGPALYMAISRTLMRTYAYALHEKPENVLFATNQRILQDTRANLFVTIFIGILQPETGELVYCNAGHHPPFIFGNSRERGVVELGRTGIPVGIEENSTWGRASVSIQPGEMMLLYTDGIPDAQNEQGDFFTLDSLEKNGSKYLGQSAEVVQNHMIDTVQSFVGNAPQFDDITLMVLVRE
jgi:serine phosphatase RsbU (regulator of sigma subunit)